MDIDILLLLQEFRNGVGAICKEFSKKLRIILGIILVMWLTTKLIAWLANPEDMENVRTGSSAKNQLVNSLGIILDMKATHIMKTINDLMNIKLSIMK